VKIDEVGVDESRLAPGRQVDEVLDPPADALDRTLLVEVGDEAPARSP
jgi:hypothetical protein